ncbi:MvdC/MvdD family ATP grasp protein [uncultured Brevundimonas sp.]|uniref:ATP-grasp domain-containing protein n=1 Tax=uncultured Brevundimonas sp. TaxID=213418 RepID=UPI0030EBE2D8|tara:strand:- start:8030 stop:9040 length:1011 start_codon:yes stop_codon:yes gene_type:complete
MANRALIVTDTSDLHADQVAVKLGAVGHTPFRLNLDAFPRDFDMTLSFAEGCWRGGLTHLPSGDVLPVETIGAVWMRKKADFSYRSGDLLPQEKAYADGEMEHILFSMLYSLDCFWMSHPLAVRGASWKGEQLQRAARMGFDVPPSMITNRRADVEAFRRTIGGEMIFKTLSSPILGADEVAAEDRIAGHLSTTLITDEDDDLLDAVAELPSFFQPNVLKAYELRVTIIGDRVFAAKIHSQDDPRTAIDCRDMSAEISYEADNLPAEVSRRCLEFVHSYGLTYGAIDLIVTPEGRYVFLENNPVGQFLFVEQLVPSLDMTSHVARCLADAVQKGLP